ncbi:putative fimbrial-like protein SfmF [Klebsiella pasteurii]|nr:putative fimbrial-like protein SfmF [Klebsiella pasteurii]
MMKIKYKSMLIATLLCWNVYSADRVNIDVTGTIVAAPCVFNGGNNNLDINLGEVMSTNMATPGSTSDPVSFNLLFTHCPLGTQSVTATFTGTPDPDAGADYYKNSGTASHVAIMLSEASSGALKGSGSSITQNILADRSTTFAMRAAYRSVAGGATPGTINTAVMLTLEYN